MTTTTFIDKQTVIEATWLNDVNESVYTTVPNAMPKAALAASSGASLVGYMPAGVGAVATAVQSKLRQSVSVLDFGAMGDYSRLTKTGTDDTESLIAAIAAAKVLGAELVFPSTPSNIGYYTTKTLDFTGLRAVNAVGTAIYVRSSVFDATIPWAVTFGNSATDYSDITGYFYCPELWVEDVDDRQSELNGVYLKLTAGNFGRIRARRFNGSGVRGAPVWDSNFTAVETEYCGNLTTYAIDFIGNGDESNAITFNSILCHDSYHKGLRIAGSKNEITRAHIERTYVLSTSDGTSAADSALTYNNHDIRLTSGVAGSLDFNDASGSSYPVGGKTPNDIDTVLNQPSAMRITLDAAASLDNCNSSKSIVDIFGGSTGIYSSIGAIKMVGVYLNSGCRASIGNVQATTLSVKDSAAIQSGRATTVTRMAGMAQYLQVDNAYGFNETIGGKWLNCTLTGGITRLGTAEQTFIDCAIGPITINTSEATEKAKFIGGSTGAVTIDGVGSANKELKFSDVRINGNWSHANYTHGVVVTVNSCRCSGTVTGWDTPKAGFLGDRTERLGAGSAGQGMIFVCTNTGPATFTAIASRP